MKPARFTSEQERLIQQLVSNGITTRRHAERVVSRNKHSVLAAWLKQLAKAQANRAKAGVQ